MKKQYIVPAIHGHKLSIESHVLANSPVLRKRIEWGNKPVSQDLVAPYTNEQLQSDDYQNKIDVVEGNDISNI